MHYNACHMHDSLENFVLQVIIISPDASHDSNILHKLQ